jgi:hypothetical protein
MQFHRDMLDLEPILSDINQQMPVWALYSIATIIGTAFGTSIMKKNCLFFFICVFFAFLVLILISRMPVRLYYSPVRHSYALFYHPVIGVSRQKKILFRDDQYKIIPQKLDSIESPERSIKIRIELSQGLLRMKSSFYLIENLFRSKRDIRRIRMENIENDETKKEQNQTQDETDIWETVVEQKDQRSSQRRT